MMLHSLLRRAHLDRSVVAAVVVASFVCQSVGSVAALPTVADAVDVAADVAAGPIADASLPSMSADGRWVVFEGTVQGRRSVFRTDRQERVTVELSLVPAGVRSGDTIRPTVSADGCVVAAITEIPYDLFRDDDHGERRDVYRLVVPECGGQPNGWQLVSLSERTGVARDDVFVDSSPALSGVGALVAYVHQASNAPEGVATISLVDMTVPLGEPGSVQQVAGMPTESPGGAFLYHGARHPVLSQNGRHLAFVSDTTASEALPGWGAARSPVTTPPRRCSCGTAVHPTSAGQCI